MLLAKKIDAKQGAIIPKIILYSVPVILSTLVQSLFNAVDMVVLGNMADDVSVASVGATSTIVSLLITSFFGFSSGIKVLIARFIGEGSAEKIKKTVDTTVILGIALGLILSIVGWIASPIFLNLTNCPEECFAGALTYMRIYLLSAPAIILYNFGSAIITANGDTQRPLYYMLFCGLLNVVLNVILCIVLKQKVAAVAIATAASQILGAVLVVIRLCRIDDLIKLKLASMRFDITALKKIVVLGAPIALSNALFPLANLQILAAVNSYGPMALAGNSASHTLQTISSPFHAGISATTAVFMGQNLGAQKHDRVKKSFFNCLWISFFVGLAEGLFFYHTGRFWLGFIIDDPIAIDYAMIGIEHIIQFYFIAALNGVLSHALQAFGYSTLSSANSIFCVFVFRMIWMNFIYPYIESFRGLMFCYTVSWLLMLIANLIFITIIYQRYKKGKYKKL